MTDGDTLLTITGAMVTADSGESTTIGSNGDYSFDVLVGERTLAPGDSYDPGANASHGVQATITINKPA